MLPVVCVQSTSRACINMTSTGRTGLSKKQLAAMSKWANKPRTESLDQTTEKFRDLWDALNQFVIERGAQITSVKYANPLTLEIPLDSPLPDKLKELGYDLIYCERTTRIGGTATPAYHTRWRRGPITSGYGFNTVDVFLIRLPK